MYAELGLKNENMETVPGSLRQFAQHQNVYRQQLEKLPYYNMVSPIIEGFLRKIIDEGAFYTRVHVSALGDILETGRIKSVMETGRGATAGGKDTRKAVTEALFGCRAGKLTPAEFPKYGFLSQADAHKDLLLNAAMWCQYGDVSIQLKKERLMHRTTLCVGNSVNFGRCYTLVPTCVDDVKATCLCGLPHDGKPLVALPNPMSCYMLFASWILEHKLTVGNFPMLESVAQDAPPLFEFFELQLHGNIDILHDVERIDVMPSSQEEKDMLLGYKAKCDAMGVKMFVCDRL